jgi:L-ascorbate metabolism protein UlaG (beta-lactamase superfamily)
MSGAVTWLGHATVVVDLDGERIVTDPVLRRRVAHLLRARAAAVPADATAVLVSHLHYDHLDVPSLRAFARELPVLLPRGGARLLRGFGDLREVEPGDSVRIGELRVDAVEADHDGRRRPGGARGPALGYVLRGSRSVYFAGDTDLFDEMAELAPVDVALLPVAGWGPRLGPGHMTAERAARAAVLLRPRVAIPIHWGTFHPAYARRGAWFSDPPLEFAAHVAAVAPSVDVRVLMPGESTSVST